VKQHHQYLQGQAARLSAQGFIALGA